MSDSIAPASPPPLLRRHIAAATVGNALEFYDFITYAFFAIQIGHAFFPSHSAFASLMLSLAAFGAGFATRPLGAVVIGIYSDRVGRRPAMMLSFTLMGIAIVTIALIPSYATIGIAAPILAVLARMVQGFSLGGEVGPNTAYLLEAAKPLRRGLIVNWQGASQGIAGTFAGVVGMLLSETLTPSGLDAYGWRIAFLIGAVTLPFGLMIRRALPETLHRAEENAVAQSRTGSLGEILHAHGRLIVLSLLVIVGATVGTYVTNYLTTYAENTLHLDPVTAFGATVVNNGVGIFAVLLGGWLSDRYGRRWVMVLPNVLFLVLVVPVFTWMVAAHSALALLAGTAVLSLVGALGIGAFYPAFSESLPKRIRGSTFAIVYAATVSLFGGTTQLVVTWLIKATGSPLAPAWYLFAATAAGTLAMFFMRESAPVKIAMEVSHVR
ncbi:MAG: MFS transporter [Rhizomicrobium sp.]|jgi:MFS family permease